MAWDMNELVALGFVVLSVTLLTLVGKVQESNYMLILTAVTTYVFGRIMNHAQGKEEPNLPAQAQQPPKGG